MRKVKSPTVVDGLNTLFNALRDDVLALVELSLKKTENGLRYLEKEIHHLKTMQHAQKKTVSRSHRASSAKKPSIKRKAAHTQKRAASQNRSKATKKIYTKRKRARQS